MYGSTAASPSVPVTALNHGSSSEETSASEPSSSPAKMTWTTCLRGRSPAGVYARIAQRLLALATAIWHNRITGATPTRSLTAYDH